jgi:8-oxo-dGTP pyrophosphatase MutT (NUDIX family)
MVQRTAVSAGAFILRAIEGELKVALAQHNRSEKTWAIPKGHVEPGETIEEAALREIYEEAGLFNVQLIKYLGNILRERTKSNGDVELKTIHYYLAYDLEDDTQKDPTDAAFVGVGWFSPQQAIELLYHEEERTFFREHLAPLLALSYP